MGNDIAGAGFGDAGSARRCAAHSGHGPHGCAAAVDIIRAAWGRWLWHDLTTVVGTDLALLRGARRAGVVITGAEGSRMQGQMTMMPMMMMMMTESVALHVLVAVMQHVCKLFVLKGQQQLDALVDTGSSSAGGGGGGGGSDVMEPTMPAAAGEDAILYDVTIISPARLQRIANHCVLILVHQRCELAIAIGAHAVVERQVVAGTLDKLIP
jgi:hypothetical protein